MYLNQSHLAPLLTQIKAEVREGEHGQHDIEREIRHPAKRHLVIHDSRGFQARADGEQSHNGDTPRPGEVDIVRRFLADHLSCPDINDRLHVIWFVCRLSLIDAAIV